MSLLGRTTAAAAMLALVAALTRIDDAVRTATARTATLRLGLLIAPQAAAHRHCAALASGLPKQPCRTLLTWRRGGRDSPLCADLARDGDIDGAVWRARRHYRIETRCSLRVGPFAWPWRPMRARIVR